MKRASIAAGLLLLGALAVSSSGCATQRIEFPAVSADLPAGEEFENSGYTWYLLFDLVPVKKAKVQDLIAEVNPRNLAVQSVEVTSEEDPLATLVNILNGGVIDRGVIVSLNKVTVRGRFVADR